jgi:hypothetical protein
VSFGWTTEVGSQHLHNEDMATIAPDLFTLVPCSGEYRGSEATRVSLFGVFDGHGGHRCSSVCSLFVSPAHARPLPHKLVCPQCCQRVCVCVCVCAFVRHADVQRSRAGSGQRSICTATSPSSSGPATSTPRAAPFSTKGILASGCNVK